jgi:adenosine kinase
MNIYISGSLAYDRIMDFPGFFHEHILPEKIHMINVSFTVNSMKEKYGGTAGNIAYTLRLLGEKPTVLATIGKDFTSYFQWFKLHDIETESVKIIHTELTAGAYITTDKADNQITGFNPGAMKFPSEFHFPLEEAAAIGLMGPGNLTDMINYAKHYKANRIDCICDPGQSLPAWEPGALKEWIRGSNILIANDYEIELISRMIGTDRKGLLELVPTIIVTLGDKGSVITTSAGEIKIPSVKAEKVVDPTGAGDAYRGGLLKGLITGKDIETSARMGAVAAVYAVERYGTQEHHFKYDQFLERYRKNFGSGI